VLHVPGTDKVFLVLDYADRGSVAAWLARRQRLPLATILSIVRQTAMALDHMHSSGYVHQDVKPGNILMDRGGRVLLADFGIGHSLLSADLAVGTPGYQAPEVLDDSYGDECRAALSPPKEDVWALGVTLYQMLFLTLPFAGENLYEIVRAIQVEPLSIPDGTDPAIAELIRGMLAVKQCERLSIREVLEHPLVSGAPERAVELPGVPEVVRIEGEVRSVAAVVCGEDFSFSAISQRRRLSVHESLGRHVRTVRNGITRSQCVQ
jgi:serine/threonine protein kinase